MKIYKLPLYEPGCPKQVDTVEIQFSDYIADKLPNRIMDDIKDYYMFGIVIPVEKVCVSGKEVGSNVCWPASYVRACSCIRFTAEIDGKKYAVYLDPASEDGIPSAIKELQNKEEQAGQ